MVFLWGRIQDPRIDFERHGRLCWKRLLEQPNFYSEPGELYECAKCLFDSRMRRAHTTVHVLAKVLHFYHKHVMGKHLQTTADGTCRFFVCSCFKFPNESLTYRLRFIELELRLFFFYFFACGVNCIK